MGVGDHDRSSGKAATEEYEKAWKDHRDGRVRAIAKTFSAGVVVGECGCKSGVIEGSR
jgi:hypothetical protein